jgi:hypothetical protein
MGSVVVPAKSETMAKFCPVIALISVDFPIFLFPKIEICNLFELGVLFKFDIEITS